MFNLAKISPPAKLMFLIDLTPKRSNEQNEEA